MYSVECVSKIKSFLSLIFYAMYGAACLSTNPFFFGWLWEYLYFIL